MHVVQVVCSPAFAGAERQVAAVAGGLAARGVEVTVVGGSQAELRAAVPSEVTLLPGDDLRATLRSLWSLRGRGVDVLHAHMTAAETAAALVARRLGARLVATRHFAGPRGHTFAGRAVRPLISARLDRQLAVSAFVASAIDEPSTVLPNGVPEPPAWTGSRGPTVLVLQRFEPEKDTATALRAWAASGLGDEGWRLRLHGRGSGEAELCALAVRLGITGSVEFAGFTDTPHAALAGAAVLLATARAEPFGLSVVEAMATSTPVLASDAGAHRETLGEHGWFFETADIAEAAAGLRALAHDERDRNQRGAALRTRYLERFTLERHLDGLRAVYESLAAHV